MSVEPLLTRERHALILARLQQEGRVLAPQLAVQLRVTEDTVRRDLRDLAAAGLCQKVYGGAVRLPAPPHGGTLVQRQRQRQQTAVKTMLAQAAARIAPAGGVLFIDAGSTNLEIAMALPELPLTVITNAPSIAVALQGRPLVELIMLGGRVDPRSGAVLGAAAAAEVDMLRPDLYVIGACGVDAGAGVSAFYHEEAQFKRRVAAVSKATLVAATADKLGTAAPYLVLPTARLTHLILPAEADAAQEAAFGAQGVQVTRADHDRSH